MTDEPETEVVIEEHEHAEHHCPACGQEIAELRASVELLAGGIASGDEETEEAAAESVLDILESIEE